MKTITDFTIMFLSAANMEVNSETIRHYKFQWWFNIRKKSSGGLRLTQTGLDFAKNSAGIKSYKIDFSNSIKLLPELYLWLEQRIESPFYITTDNIEVFTEKAAFELYLFSGDLRKMGYVKTLAKRLNQDTE